LGFKHAKHGFKIWVYIVTVKNVVTNISTVLCQKGLKRQFLPFSTFQRLWHNSQ